MTDANAEKVGLIDRLAVGFLSAIAALLTGTFIWFITLFALMSLHIDYSPPFASVGVFTGVMFALGFATRINLLTSVLGAIWHFLYHYLRLWA